MKRIPRRIRRCDAIRWFEESTGLSLGTPEPVPDRPGRVRPFVEVFRYVPANPDGSPVARLVESWVVHHPARLGDPPRRAPDEPPDEYVARLRAWGASHVELNLRVELPPGETMRYRARTAPGMSPELRELLEREDVAAALMDALGPGRAPPFRARGVGADRPRAPFRPRDRRRDGRERLIRLLATWEFPSPDGKRMLSPLELALLLALLGVRNLARGPRSRGGRFRAFYSQARRLIAKTVKS